MKRRSQLSILPWAHYLHVEQYRVRLDDDIDNTPEILEFRARLRNLLLENADADNEVPFTFFERALRDTEKSFEQDKVDKVLCKFLKGIMPGTATDAFLGDLEERYSGHHGLHYWFDILNSLRALIVGKIAERFTRGRRIL